ncbi:MAG: hypothetical protein J3Q66DRAFT_414162 [Benniella sp.]|nr:MAG: hypothetical protein J3Q66DRAFT_414162 [Benniella sp.]
MADIAELDELISQQLSQHDLAQCIRVSRKWFRLFAPHLWGDLSCLENPSKVRQQAFGRVVLEDYLLKHQHQESEDEDYDAEQPLPTTLSSRPLAKYGPWIRELPYPRQLYIILHSVCDLDVDFTATELMRHLYKQCPIMEFQHLTLFTSSIEWDELMEVVSEYVIPRTRSLRVEKQHRHHDLESWRLKYVLRHCSSIMEELTIQTNVIYLEDDNDKEDDDEEAQPWTQLKRLELKWCLDWSEDKAFWAWLWKRCSHVEHLVVNDMDDVRQSLAEGILTHMPNLNKIHLEGTSWKSEEIVAILSASRQGWKKVSMSCLSLSPTAMTCLMNHSSTLERLMLDGIHGVTHSDKIQVLRCCPMLYEFSDAGQQSNSRFIDVHSFVDQDPDTGSLKAWESEASLRALKICIVGIPRPELYESQVIKEDYPGQGQELHNRVYARLARLTNLESLWLGEEGHHHGAFSCLEMSLESGLDGISGLKALRELNVSSMRTRIGEREVQWMVEHWPKLRVIHGLLEKGRDKKAVEWLQQHHPDISLK